MKILIISPGYLPVTGNHGGAIENLINIYLKYNEKMKDEIVVYSAKNEKELFDNQIYNDSKFRVIDKTKLSFKIIQKILNLINKFNDFLLKKNYIRLVVKDIIKRKEENYYDLIIFENGQNYIEYFTKKIHTKSKLVLHLHNDYLNKETKRGKEIVNSFNQVWTVSKFIKKSVEEIETKDKDKIKVLYNTIDYSLFEKKLEDKEMMDIRTKYNIKEEDYIYLYVGRVMEEKGTLELVKSFLKVNEKYNNTKLIVIGGNKSLSNSGEYLDLVRKIANNNPNIILTGQIKNTELYKYYKIANVQIIPSLWNEAFGLIALEGIAANVPIISTKVGGLPEILKDSGVYINKDNIIAELEEKMEYAFHHKSEMNHMTKNYSKIKKEFSEEEYCSKFKLLIDNIGGRK